jgi:hypothetical protein
MSTWIFRCQHCEKCVESDVSLNQTIWDMEKEGWLFEFHGSGSVKTTLCPVHVEARPRFTVECLDCWYEEVFYSLEEAKEEVRYHNEDCDHDDHEPHSAKILTEHDIALREARREAIRSAELDRVKASETKARRCRISLRRKSLVKHRRNTRALERFR